MQITITSDQNGRRIIQAGPPPSEAARFEAARARRDELTDQLSQLRAQHSELVGSVNAGLVKQADRPAVDARITLLEERIGTTRARLAEAKAEVAALAPAATTTARPPGLGPIPDNLLGIGIVATASLLMPFVIVLAIRLVRRRPQALPSGDRELMARLSRLEQAVDSIAVEVERVAEGQRYVSKVLGERSAARVLQDAP